MGTESDDESAVWTEASTATPGVYSAASRRFHHHGEGDEYSTMTPRTNFSAFDKFFSGFDPILDAVPIPGDVASCPSGDDVESGADIDAETEADAEVAEKEREDEEEEEGRDEHQPKAELEHSSTTAGNILSRDDDDDGDDGASRNVRSQSHSHSQGRRIVIKSYHHGTHSAREDYTDQDDQKHEQTKDLDQQNDYSQTGRLSGRKNKHLHEKRRLGLFEINISNKEEMTLNGQGSLTDSDDDDDDKDSIVSNDKSFIFDSTDMAQRGRTRAVHVPDYDTSKAASAKSILKHHMDSGKFKNRWNQKLQHLHQQQTPQPEEKKVRYKIQVKVDDDVTESREVREEEGLGCPQRSFEIQIEDDDREVESVGVDNDLQTTQSTESKSVSTVRPLSVKPNLFIDKESQVSLPSSESISIKKNRRVVSKLKRWTKTLRKFSAKLSFKAETIDEWPSSRVQIEEYSYDESSVASEILISQPKVLVEAEKKELKKMGEIVSTEEAITKLLERRNKTREVRLAAAIGKKTMLNNIVEEQETDEPTNPTADHPRLERILSALVDDPNNDLGCELAEDNTSIGVEVRALDMSAINAVV